MFESCLSPCSFYFCIFTISKLGFSENPNFHSLHQNTSKKTQFLQTSSSMRCFHLQFSSNGVSFFSSYLLQTTPFHHFPINQLSSASKPPSPTHPPFSPPGALLPTTVPSTEFSVIPTPVLLLSISPATAVSNTVN